MTESVLEKLVGNSFAIYTIKLCINDTKKMITMMTMIILDNNLIVL